MAYNYTVVYISAEGRQCKVDCGSSSNIALGICRIQLGRGAKSAIVEVKQVNESTNK